MSIAWWHLKSPAWRLFTQPFIQEADQRKHPSSVSLAFVRGIHQWPMNSPHRGPITRKMFQFDNIIMRKVVSMYSFSVTCWLFVYIYGAVAFPVLLTINLEYPYRLSKHSVSMISFSEHLKLTKIILQSRNLVEWAILKETVNISDLMFQSSISEQA